MPDHRFDLTRVGGIQKFSDAKLQAAIESAVRRQTKDGLIVVAHADSEGNGQAYLSAAYRFGDEVAIVAAVYKERHKPFSFGGEVVWTPDW
jgi:hypothetical protein